MSDFITESDPITQHDWTPGHAEHTPTVSERIWKIQLEAASLFETFQYASKEYQAAMNINFRLIDAANTKSLGQSVTQLQGACGLCQENGIKLNGLDEITAELEKALDEQESERPDYYPGARG